MKDFFGHEFDALSQMNALVKKLAIANIPFEVRGFPSTLEYMAGTLQVCVPSVKEPILDVVCHGGSYGHQDGLMEALVPVSYSDAHDWGGENVKGWLDADEAFELITDVLAFQRDEAAE